MIIHEKFKPNQATQLRTSRNRKTWTIYNHVRATQRVKEDGVVQELKQSQSQGNEKHTNLSDSDDKAEDSTEEKESGRAEEVNPVDVTEHVGRVGKIIGRKTKGKKKTLRVCSKCGETLAQWWAKCPSCGVFNTVREFHEVKSGDSGKVTGFSVSENAVRSGPPQKVGELQPVRLKDVNGGKCRNGEFLYLVLLEMKFLEFLLAVLYQAVMFPRFD